MITLISSITTIGNNERLFGGNCQYQVSVQREGAYPNVIFIFIFFIISLTNNYLNRRRTIKIVSEQTKKSPAIGGGSAYIN
jgi:hypothetical protein